MMKCVKMCIKDNILIGRRFQRFLGVRSLKIDFTEGV